MDSIRKFQSLLENLFQFDASNLDFGIYRILNFKRDQIRKFIHEDLKAKVEIAFTKHKDDRTANIDIQLEDAKQKVIQSLGAGAILATGELKDEFKGTPVGRDYLSLKGQKEEAETIDEIKLQVFSDLYNFFSRYYEEGDFVPQYRYSIKNHKYAIPYNGEEVKLYWANCDQYYTKTGILFRDYAFFTDIGKTFRIILRTVSAKEELGSNKATKARFFVLDGDNPWEMQDRMSLIIRLQYRELSSGEVNKYGIEGGSNASRQEKINSTIHNVLVEGMQDNILKAFLGKSYKNDKPLLLYQLGRFTAKNTRDYFIHKNLKKFLCEQLDYFIKAEVISLETLEKERFFDKHITRAKVVREIGEKLIDFLSQIEDFQKKLWEKKKFVLKTEYVITTDLVPEELYAEILKNKAQAKEWSELGFEGAKSKEGLKAKKLPIDTKHFPEEFKERLLERLSERANLDDLLDGLLIKSENWQALHMLFPKFKEKIDCVYIDPPFNTAATEILYKNNYKHSSWMSLISDRLRNVFSLISNKAIMCVAIDDFELPNLNNCLSSVFGDERHLATAAVRSNPHGRAMAAGFSPNHEYALFYGKTEQAVVGRLPRDEKKQSRYPETDEKGIFSWMNFRKTGAGSNRSDRPKLFYPIYVSTDGAIRVPSMIWANDQKLWLPLESEHEDEIIVLPLDAEKHDRVWNMGWERAQDEANVNLLAKQVDGEWQIYRKYRPRQEGALPGTWWENAKYSATESGTRIIKDLLGERESFSYPKSVYLVEDCLRASACSKNALVLDFFSGSGTTAHAAINLNRYDGGRRKYILIEMASYFEDVLVPRIKKVVYCDEWKDGKPQNSNGISHFIKYQYLEQYEDALDNLELAPDKTIQGLFGADYLLKYFLDFETQDNSSLLNIEHLQKPFCYKLKVNLEEVGEPQEVIVDIPETFLYLLGLKVNKVKVRRHKGKKYLFTLGEKESRTIAVIWREYDDEWTQTDFKRDKEFIIEELSPWSPQIVYVNGQNVLTPTFGEYNVEIRSIEPEFKALMVTSL